MDEEMMYEEMDQNEEAAYTAVIEVMERINPTLAQAQRVFAYLLADVSYEIHETPEIPQDVLDLVESAYLFSAAEASETLLN